MPKNWGYDAGGIQIDTTFLNFSSINLTYFIVNFTTTDDLLSEDIYVG